MRLNYYNFFITMMLIPMIVAGAVVNAAEPTSPSPEEVQRHFGLYSWGALLGLDIPDCLRFTAVHV